MGAETRNRREDSPGVERSAAGIQVFTLGYEGRTLSEVLQIVRAQGIEQLLDVRETASSRKAGFSSADLQEALARTGVTYVHLPNLGCERESRHALWRGGDTDPFLEGYRQRLAQRPQDFHDLLRRVRSARTLLLCLERDPSRCHRAVLGERLRAEGLTVRDL